MGEIMKKGIKFIQDENDFIQYVKLISSIKDIAVVIAVRDTIGFEVQADGYEALHILGLSKLDMSNKKSNHWKGYVAILDNGELIFEKIGRLHESIFFDGYVKGKHLEVASAPLHRGDTASILIDEKEYCVNKRGINFVCISSDGNVIDSVAFDTHVIGRACTRINKLVGGVVVPINRINLLNRNIEESIKRLNVNCITNGLFDKEIEKIKVRLFFFGGKALWPSIESVMEEFEEDERFDVLVIMYFNDKVAWRIIYEEHHKLMLKNEYKIEKDKPDIILYNSEIFSPSKEDKTVLTIYIGAGLNDGKATKIGTDEWMNYLEYKMKADAYIVEKHLAKREKWIGMGNPKFDLIYNCVNQVNKVPKSWEKLKNKTIILWAPDHQYTQKDVTFDLYIKPFFDYFRTNLDMGLIIRLHPVYPEELIRGGVWSEKDLQRLIRYTNSFPNVVWDDRKDYGLAYSMADAVLTDINCGVTISSLPLNVPVAVLLRYDGEICLPNFPDEIEGLYQIHNIDEAYAFFDNVKKRKDPLKEKRNSIMRRYVANFDGKNGFRIKKFIEEKYFDALGKKEKEKQVQLINSLIVYMPIASVALYLGNGTSREAYLALSLENRKKIVCIIDNATNCACSDLDVPIVPLKEVERHDVRSILVVARTLPGELKDFFTTQEHGIHAFGLYGWFEVNGYYTKHNFYDFAIQSMDAPLPTPLSIPDFLYHAAPGCSCEVSVVMVVQDESTLLSRLHDILRQVSLGVRIYCLDLTGKAAEVVKDYQKVTSCIEVIRVDGYSSLPEKMNELISSANTKYILFLSADEHLHAKGLFYLHEIAEQMEAEVAAAGLTVTAKKNGKPDLTDFSTGSFELKKEASILPPTFNERYAEWSETGVPSFTGSRLYRVDFLRKYNIIFPAIRFGWRDIFCLQTIFESAKYVKVPSPVCISSNGSLNKSLDVTSVENAKELVGDMFAYQQAIETLLRQMNAFGNNSSLCDKFRERAMTIFDQQYFSGMTLDDEMRKAVSQAVQEELQKNPSIGMWWIKYLFMRSSFPQNV